MKPYDQAEIKHEGRHQHRLATNPAERVFSEEWRKQQEQSQTLQWLLCVSPDQKFQERDITQEEATSAEIVVGSVVDAAITEPDIPNANGKVEGE